MEATAQPNGTRGIHRRITFTITHALRERFWNNVAKGEPDECWPWIGAPRNGYGAIKHERKVLGAHVVAYRLTHGELPDGMLVTHSCDNRLCCNPKHLEAGTFKKNVDDMIARRAMNATRGEASYNAVLTDDQVRLVRAYKVHCRFGAKKVSKLLGVSLYAMKGVLSGETWKHIAWPSADEAKQLVEQHRSSSVIGNRT